MKTLNKILTAFVLVIMLTFGLTEPIAIHAAFGTGIAPTLGAAESYAIYSDAGETNAGDATSGTRIWGNVGDNGVGRAGNNLTTTQVPLPSVIDAGAGVAADAFTGAGSAYGQMSAQAPAGGTISLSGTPTVVPGVYDIGTLSTLNGVITLDGAGVYIFKALDSVSTTGAAQMNLIHGATACNVFWHIPTAMTIGAGAHIEGTIITGPGGENITLASGASLVGRAFAHTQITLDNNSITEPVCAAPATLNVIKDVVTDNGGDATAANWELTVASTDGGSGTGHANGGTGTIYTLETGHQYSVTENAGPAGYAATLTGDCTIASAVAGTTYTCTIRNNDIAPQLIVTKTIIGSTKVPTDFSFFIDGASVLSGIVNTSSIGSHTVSETPNSDYTTVIGGNCTADGNVTLSLGDLKTCTITNRYISHSSGGSYIPPVPPLIEVLKVPSPLALPNGAGLVKYTYTLKNIGTVPVSDITMVGDTCSPIVLISGDTNNDSKLDVDETWIHTCSTTLTATHTNTVTATGQANGITATDIASATVVVGVPIIPPLIHVVKVPSVFTLFAPGGAVTYTYTVTNPGTEPLSDVGITDDKCTGLPSRVVEHPGDLNKNNLLESNETWTFTCKTNLTETTTNTGTAQGSANGLIARDFSIATVVVASVVPTLPATGIVPTGDSNYWGVVIPIGVLVIMFSLYLILKKRSN